MIRARALCAIVLLAAFAIAPAQAGKNAGIFYYVTPGTIDLTQLLSPPPDPSSAMERYDEHKMAQVLSTRTALDMAQANHDAKRTIFVYADVLGPAFSEDKLPKAAALFKHAGSDVEVLVEQAKAFFERPRPPGAPQTHGSYPSGHSAFASMSAILLAQIVPERRAAIFQRADVFAESRIVAGVHYPSDVQAGWISGTVVAADLLALPRFQADFAAVRIEVRRALGYAK